MIDLRKGAGIILPLVAKKTKHRDYAHVVEYAEDYTRPLYTGKGIDKLVHRFNKRETEDDHEQRIRLTVATSPAVINKVMGPVRKIPRVKPNVNRADFGPERKEDTAELMKAAGTFYAGKNVDHFLGSVALDYGAIDPNGFCLISFDKFDGRYQKPRVYPTLISCVDAWNYEYWNGELQWLLVHRHITFTEAQHTEAAKKKKATDPEVVTVNGHYFCAYLDNHHMQFTQVDRNTIRSKELGLIIDADGNVIKGFEPGATAEPSVAFDTFKRYYFRVSSAELYEVVFYKHDSGIVQAFRMGWKLDMETDGRTCVSLWHAGLPYLLKGIKAGSELDISASLHAFLKEYSYGPRCLGYTEQVEGKAMHYDCNGGTDPGGEVCKACKGTGMFRIKSGQDHVTLPLPPRGTELTDLTKLHHYAELPVEVLEWQDKYKAMMDQLVYEAVYNSEPFSRDQVQPTATAEIRDQESVYDTLQPGCSWYAESRVLIMKLMATYVVGKKMEEFVNQYQFPRNLRFESIGDLVALKKALLDAGASSALLLQVEKDIMEHIFVDDERAMLRAVTMISFDPFAGKQEATNLSLVSQDLATKEDKVLWTNMAKVFNECERRATEKGVDFYDMTKKLQQELVEEIVQELVDELAEQAEEAQAKFEMGVVQDDAAATGDDPGGAEPPNDKVPNPGKPSAPVSSVKAA